MVTMHKEHLKDHPLPRLNAGRVKRRTKTGFVKVATTHPCVLVVEEKRRRTFQPFEKSRGLQRVCSWRSGQIRGTNRKRLFSAQLKSHFRRIWRLSDPEMRARSSGIRMWPSNCGSATRDGPRIEGVRSLCMDLTSIRIRC